MLEVYIMGLLEKVEELRKRKGWSQEDLAREVGVSLSTVQRWESQEVNPTRLARRELERIFKRAGMQPPIGNRTGARKI
jgi:ribosome-binding protein aMBF1 (putative translation factor)